MRHAKKGRKLGRTASHRKATMNNLATSLFLNGSIRTGRAKAKELRSLAERLITFAKRGDLHARRQVLRRIQNKRLVAKLFNEIGPSFADRNGGYTRLLKLGNRRGDNSEVCLGRAGGGSRAVKSVRGRRRERAQVNRRGRSNVGGQPGLTAGLPSFFVRPIFRRSISALLVGAWVLLHGHGAASSDELRAVWVVRHTLTTPEKIVEMVETAKQTGFNALFVQVRGRGDAYYRSRFIPPGEDVADEAFDPLGTVVAWPERPGSRCTPGSTRSSPGIRPIGCRNRFVTCFINIRSGS